MLINNKEFKIYNSDDDASIKERIAVMFNTTPKWLIFRNCQGGNSLSEYQSVEVLNVLENLDRFDSFRDVEAYYSDWIDLNSPEELAVMIILEKVKDYSSTDVPIQEKFVIEMFFSDSTGTEINWDFIENTIHNRFKIDIEYKTSVKDVESRNKKRVVMLEKENSANIDIGTIETTPFKITSYISEVELTFENDIILAEVLNNIPSSRIIFARVDKFVKIGNQELFKKFVQNESYEKPNTKATFVVLDDLGNFKHFNFDYVRKTLNKLNVEIDMHVDSQSFDEELRTIFSDRNFVYSSDIKNTSIKGEYVMETNMVRKEILFEEIMNDDKFYSMYINERKQVPRINRVMIHYYSVKTKNVNFSLGGISKHPNSNILVKCSHIKQDSDIEHMKEVINKLVTVCKVMEENIIKDYQKIYQKAFQDRMDLSNLKIKNIAAQLNEIVPELFVTLYTRKCAKPPRIVPDGTPGSIQYPLKGEGGLKPLSYSCDHQEKFKHFGIRRNTLKNADTFKYIPCCYEVDQTTKKSLLSNYLNDTEDDRVKNQEKIYKTGKLLSNNAVGELPNKFVTLFNRGTTRHGVFKSPNSFIDCVDRIMKEEFTMTIRSFTREEQLREIRSNLSSRVCAQENWDIENFEEWFYNPDLYFEPRRFVRALEEYYNVGIVIFERFATHVTSYNDGKLIFKRGQNEMMSPPNFPPLGSYYLPNKKFDKIINVFLNNGPLTETNKFPQCEILSHPSPFSESLFLEMVKPYKYSDPSPNVENVIEQYLDVAGRMVAFKNQDGEVVQLLNPIIPMDVPFKSIKSLRLNSKVNNYIFKARLARVFVEYCLIKMARLGETNVSRFINKNTIISEEHVRYHKLVSKTDIDSLDKIFMYNGKIVFDTNDTLRRVEYTMKLLLQRNYNTDYNKNNVTNYFIIPQDFDSPVFLYNEELVKSMNVKYQEMDNFLEPVTTDIVVFSNDVFPDLNGNFKSYPTLDILLSAPRINNEDSPDLYYIWTGVEFEIFKVEEGKGRIIVVYKMNGEHYHLLKY